MSISRMVRGGAFRDKRIRCPWPSMKSYALYSVEELALDDLFVWWVQQPEDDEVAAFWENFRAGNPASSETLDLARRLVTAASKSPHRRLSTSETDALRERIRTSLQHLHAD